MLSSLILGFSFGFLLQRSQFCFYSGFCSIFSGKFKFIISLLLAILIQSIAIFSLFPNKLLTALNNDFSLPTLIIGAYLFGFGMAMARTCASGAFFRIGEGSLGAFLIAISFAFGVASASNGLVFNLIKPLLKIGIINGKLYDILEISPWVCIAILAFISIFLLWIRRFEFSFDFEFKLTHARYLSIPLLAGGVLLGALGVLAWLDSFSFGRYFGFSIAQPSANLLNFIITAQQRYLNWGTFFVISIPFGAFISAKLNGEFYLHMPQDSKEFVKKIFGGLIMGIGAAMSGGCNIANTFTAPSYFALSALIATPIILCSLYINNKFIFKG